MIENHILPQIPDYILGLLPATERQEVERHTATCATCRQALQQESQIGQMVRATLQTATQSPIGRLVKRMPPVPVRRPTPTLKLTWQLAAVSVLLFLVVAGVHLRLNPPGWQEPSPSAVAATATGTQEATATLAQIETPTENELRQTAVPAFFVSPEWQATPSPVVTPVAAVFTVSSN